MDNNDNNNNNNNNNDIWFSPDLFIQSEHGGTINIIWHTLLCSQSPSKI